MEGVTENSIKKLVYDFYRKVRADVELAPVFDNVIGVTDEEWEEHLDKMVDFWSSVMLTTGKYHGNPLQKHRDIPSFDIKLFDRWLELFVETVKEIHSGPAEDEYIEKSRRIAESLKLGIYYRPDFPVV